MIEQKGLMLATTRERVIPIPWSSPRCKAPWSDRHERVLLPPQAPGHAHRVQIVRKDKIVPLK